MTKSDIENIKNCPSDRWFNDIDVFPKVKRGNYSLGRLVDAGELEMKFIKSERFYRKVNNSVPLPTDTTANG